MHSVGVKGTTVERWKRWNGSYRKGEVNRQVSVHAFIDSDTIMQCLQWNYRAWHCAGKGNGTHIAFEMCEPGASKDTAENAKAIYDRALYLCVMLCRQFNISPENVICHQEGYRLGIANNHADVFHWWGKKGTVWEQYTMKRLRTDIARELAGDTQEIAPASPTIKPKNDNRYGDMTLRKSREYNEYVKVLQADLNSILGQTLETDGLFGKATEAAVRSFQKRVGIYVDGLVGKQTKKALLEYSKV